MTGNDYVFADQMQPEFWPFEWRMEQSYEFGSLDAPESMPAGSMQRYDGEYIALQVKTTVGRWAL